MALIRTARDAERAARDWMRLHGFPDAELTPPGPDGGVDVRCRDAVAQVKAEVRPIGRPEIQQIFGVAAAEKRQALFFSIGGYTDGADAWADQAGVALFVFNLAGEIEPHNATARVLASHSTVARTPVRRRLELDGWPALRQKLEEMSGSEIEVSLEGQGPDTGDISDRTGFVVAFRPADEILGARWFVWISPCRRLDASLEDLASHTEGDGAGASDDTRALLQNKWRGVLSVNYSHTPSDADSAYRLLTTILPLESPGFSDFTFEIAEGPAIPWDEAGFASLEAIVERVEVARRSGRDTTVSGWKKRDPDQPSGSYLASGHFQVYYLAPLARFPEFLRVEITTRPGLKPPPGFNVDDRGEYEEWSRDTSGTASLLSDLRAAFAHAGWDLEDFTLRCSEREGR